MKIRKTLLAVGAGLALLGGKPAQAECSDPGRPGVDWRRCLFDRQDLSGIDLTGANLRDSSFNRADLSKSRLVDINGFGVKFLSTNLQNAVLDGARLEAADFTKADMTGASLKDADLRRASLFRAILKNSNLAGVQMRDTNTSFADFSGATWIDGKTVCAEGSIGNCR
jgi:uncharacterized protein YjbI with pentapeptide repeats